MQHYGPTVPGTTKPTVEMDDEPKQVQTQQSVVESGPRKLKGEFIHTPDNERYSNATSYLRMHELADSIETHGDNAVILVTPKQENIDKYLSNISKGLYFNVLFRHATKTELYQPYLVFTEAEEIVYGTTDPFAPTVNQKNEQQTIQIKLSNDTLAKRTLTKVNEIIRKKLEPYMVALNAVSINNGFVWNNMVQIQMTKDTIKDKKDWKNKDLEVNALRVLQYDPTVTKQSLYQVYKEGRRDLSVKANNLFPIMQTGTLHITSTVDIPYISLSDKSNDKFTFKLRARTLVWEAVEREQPPLNIEIQEDFDDILGGVQNLTV